jgi:hypothetical protein
MIVKSYKTCTSPKVIAVLHVENDVIAESHEFPVGLLRRQGDIKSFLSCSYFSMMMTMMMTLLFCFVLFCCWGMFVHCAP